VFEHESPLLHPPQDHRNDGRSVHIRLDGTPRTYRDRKDYALEAARLIKSKNPHSMVEVKDLQRGDVTGPVAKLENVDEETGQRLRAAACIEAGYAAAYFFVCKVRCERRERPDGRVNPDA
jgi:hypothetical protein